MRLLHPLKQPGYAAVGLIWANLIVGSYWKVGAFAGVVAVSVAAACAAAVVATGCGSVAATTNAAPVVYYSCECHLLIVIPIFAGLLTFVMCCVGVVVIVVYTMVL